MKPTKYRSCELCGERKLTTNTDIPYIGEECMRKKENRLKLLVFDKSMSLEEVKKLKPTNKDWTVSWIIFAVLLIISFFAGGYFL